MNIVKYIKLAVWVLAMPFTLLFSSCEETDYMTFDTSNSGVYFINDTLKYSFGVTPVEIKTYTHKIPVRIMGTVSKESRPIAYEIIQELTTAQENIHFTIGDAVVLPDSINGYIPVTVYRQHLEGDYASGYKRYELFLQLSDNEYFTPALSLKEQLYKFSFDNAIDQPDWYNAHGDKVWQENYLGVWHPMKFIKMVEYFHAIEDILPETYNKMVVLYGENLEHIPLGDPYVYRTIFVKYIYSPMYEFFSNPANRDFILEEYPDFPFDFPDPYTVA